MKLTITKESLNVLDMDTYKNAISWTPAVEYFDKPAGDEFYRLIAFIAQQFEAGTKFVDIGTYYGLSARALSTNTNSSIKTYDIYDHITDNPETLTIKNVDNVEYLLKDCMDDGDVLSEAKLIVLDVDPHDGIQERDMFDKLRSVGFKGVVILDDIKLNDGMKSFWSDIPERKQDVTAYGHWSGTGIVYFSDDYEFTFA